MPSVFFSHFLSLKTYMFICEPECLSACMVYVSCVFLVSVEVRRGVLFSGTGVTGGYWELILGPLQEHPAVSTTGPSLRPFDPIFFCGGNFLYLGFTDVASLAGQGTLRIHLPLRYRCRGSGQALPGF